MIVRWVILVAVAFLGRVAVGKENLTTPARSLVQSDRVLVIAHRGASGAAPENTLPAFRRALEIGVDLVELDYYHTSDHIPIVFHDKDLRRTTNARSVLGDDTHSIAQIPWEQARRLDAGAWFSPQFSGVSLPTLDESLDLIQTGSVTLVERKAGDAETIVQLLKKKDLLERVVVQSFDWEYLANCRRLAPALALGALGDKEVTTDKIARLEKLDVQAVGWSHTSLSPQNIAELHQRGWKVWAYTVNDEQRAKELIAAGLDGLITDFPERIKRTVPAQ